MDELGSILREAREAKGLTLVEVQDRIRISARYLEALEKGQYAALPTPVHVRGFLRNYARFLALDPQPLLERYEAQQHRQPMPVSTSSPPVITPDQPLPPRDDQPFFDPVNVNLEGSSKGPESTLRLVIIVALVIAIGLAAMRFVPLLLGRGDGRDNLTDTIQGLLESESTAESTPAGTSEALPANVTPLPINPTSRNNPGALLASPMASVCPPGLPPPASAPPPRQWATRQSCAVGSTRTSCPSGRRDRTPAASVAPEVKITSCGRQPASAATASRAASTSAFAARPSAWTEDGLPVASSAAATAAS